MNSELWIWIQTLKNMNHEDFEGGKLAVLDKFCLIRVDISITTSFALLPLEAGQDTLLVCGSLDYIYLRYATLQ